VTVTPLLGKAFFQPGEHLNALVHHENGHLRTLTEADKRTLVDSVKVVGA
jgi:hypothetical protein